MSAFDELLGELNELRASKDQGGALQKAEQDGEDEGILAAAADDNDDGVEDAGEAEPGEGDEEEEEDDEDMEKALRFVDAQGVEHEVMDATNLLKSLEARVEAQDQSVAEALRGTIDLLKAQRDALSAQSDVIKSLESRVEVLGKSGRGRKAVVSVHERESALGKSDADNTISAGEFLAKAEQAQRDGKLTAVDIAMIEGSLNRGVEVPVRLRAAVLG